MMKIQNMILIISLAVSGCSQKRPCPPDIPCSLPLFKTYKSPVSKPLQKPKIIDGNMCIVPFNEYMDLYSNKEYYKAQLGRCNKTLIKSNETYHKKEKK